jgi:hypothetical protein
MKEMESNTMGDFAILLFSGELRFSMRAHSQTPPQTEGRQTYERLV